MTGVFTKGIQEQKGRRTEKMQQKELWNERPVTSQQNDDRKLKKGTEKPKYDKWNE